MSDLKLQKLLATIAAGDSPFDQAADDFLKSSWLAEHDHSVRSADRAQAYQSAPPMVGWEYWMPWLKARALSIHTRQEADHAE